MAAKKADEKKFPYTYRAKPSIQEKALKKVKKENKTLSLKIEELLFDYISR